MPEYLDIPAAAAAITAAGIETTERQMRRKADQKDLPFFKDGAKRYIDRRVLFRHYDDLQSEAERQHLRRQNVRERRNASRSRTRRPRRPQAGE